MSSPFELLHDFTKAIQNNIEPDEVLEKAAVIGLKLTNANNVIIALYDNILNELYCRFCRSQSTQFENDFFRFEMGKGFVGWVAKNRKTIRLKNARNDNRFDPEIDKQNLNEVTSVLSVPMMFQGNLKGVLQVTNKVSKSSFSKTDEYKLSVLAAQIAGLIENNRLLEENLSQSLLSHIGQNIANSAHGIKNILNNIDGGTFIVERGVSGQHMDMVDKGWEIMKRNSFRLRELVLDMLLFSRPSKPEYISCDINKICRDVYELIKEKAKQEFVEIVLRLDTTLAQVLIDPKGIYRAILNLVSNALSSFKEKENRLVRIETKNSDEKDFQIIICDNGAGISDENLNHIFDVFFTTKGSKGTGLGLPVTKKIIIEHNGSIDVTSNLNDGTVFTITLPKNKL